MGVPGALPITKHSSRKFIMVYRIPHEFWTLGNNEFYITDSEGNQKFRVAGTAFDWGTNLSFQDLDGNELATIGQEFGPMAPVYSIERDGEVFAEVKKEWSWAGKSFTLDVPGPNDYSISGRFSEYEFHFIHRGAVVAKVSKIDWNWEDSYGVDIIDGEDEIAILCTTIIIDEVLFEQDRKM